MEFLRTLALNCMFIYALGIVIQWLTILVRKVNIPDKQCALISTCIVVIYIIIKWGGLAWM